MISLAMAQPIEVVITKQLKTLYSELDAIKEITYSKVEPPILPTKTIEEVLEEINVLEVDLLHLRSLRDKENITTKVRWAVDEEPHMNISEAIGRIKLMRSRLALYQQMAASNPNPVSSRWDPENLTKITYDPNKYRQIAKVLEKQINALSIAIDVANASAQIDFDPSGYLEGLL